MELLRRGGHDPRNAAFMTAFLDRGSSAYRRLASRLAWDSVVWFASEPDKLIVLRDAGESSAGLFEFLN